MNLLNNLNENQKKAVLTKAKYVRVIAGAGSGKTRVLITRIAHLIQDENIPPYKILAITFTNKAANEMKERLRKQVGNDSAVWISTIHSLCVRILREDITSMDMPRNFTIMDADDQKSILKEAYREYEIDKKYLTFNSALNYIANNKAANISADRAMELAYNLEAEKTKALIYRYYLQRQKALYALDFDDLLLVTVKMFKAYPEVLKKWSRRFHHILVDEFQDVDQVQYDLVKMLTAQDNYLYVVGDPDQTIYTWRGADVNIIMNYENDFVPSDTIVLNQNYRSTQNILNGANSVIKCNKYRIDKELFSQNEAEHKIIHYTAASDDQEAMWIANKIEDAVFQKKKSYEDFAILYRSNYLSRAIEKSLLDRRIPYIIYGGIKFYERAEIKDALCYLRMISSADDLAFKRIINTPKRGIGKKSLDKIYDRAKQLNCSMFEVIQNEKLFTGKVQATLDQFVRLIELWRSYKTQNEVFELLEMCIDQSGYRKMLEADNEVERVENLKELINDVQDFTYNNPESTLDEYLQLVSLYGDKDNSYSSEVVRLMTIHAAKGLEFDTVFVCGLSDGVFPNERAMSEGVRGVEEERRLAYVAFTRAKNHLYLTDVADFSFIINKTRTTSRFVKEIDAQYIEEQGLNKVKTPTLMGGSTTNNGQLATFTRKTNESKEIIRWHKGDMCLHTKFGEGVVVKIQGKVMEIAFKLPYGVKKLMKNHPALSKMEKKS